MISEAEYGRMREDMVREQLIGRGISDAKVLAAFRKVPRHLFVEENLRKHAYADYPLPISLKQTISQPYIVALMTELLALKGGEMVLEVGTGSGYQAAILAEIAGFVYSVERFGELAADSTKTLKALGYKNFEIRVGDGTLGWEEHMPYDGIVVTAGAPDVPAPLAKQLADGGRLVIPVGGAFGQILTVVQRSNGSIKSEGICGCTFVPLVGEKGWAEGDF